MTVSRLKYGYLGPEGTFTEEVAQRIFAGSEYEAVPFSSNRGVLEAVAARVVDAGVVPIENSLEGSVTEVVDTIVRLHGLWITGEVLQPIQHDLIGLRGVELQQVRRILSHPQAFGQCQTWLSQNLPQAALEAVASTAAAVQSLGSGDDDETCVAIGNRRAAAMNQRTAILVEGIQDSRNNTTRFVTMGRVERPKDNQACKTSIVFSAARDVPGSLVDALAVLKVFGINMTKIESRPNKSAIGDYVFLIDFLGHHGDDMIAPALQLLEMKWVTQFRLLGSYPQLPGLPTALVD